MRGRFGSVVADVVKLWQHGHESVNRLDQNLKQQMRITRK